MSRSDSSNQTTFKHNGNVLYGRKGPIKSDKTIELVNGNISQTIVRPAYLLKRLSTAQYNGLEYRR